MDTKRLLALGIALAVTSCEPARAQYPYYRPLPGPGADMPTPRYPYSQTVPPVTRDPYYRPVPPGMNLEREYREYRDSPRSGPYWPNAPRTR